MGRVLLGQQVPAVDIGKRDGKREGYSSAGWLVGLHASTVHNFKVRKTYVLILLFNESKGRELFVRSKEFFTLLNMSSYKLFQILQERLLHPILSFRT